MKKSKYFVLREFLTYKEITMFLILFLFLMVVFFPKGKIEELLLSSQETNKDLAKKYLGALIKVKSPENLKAVFLKKFAQIGSEEEVKKLIQKVKRENPKLSLEVEYIFLKQKYFSNKENKEFLIKQLRDTLSKLILLENNPEKLKEWFKESVSMNFPELAYLSAKKLAALTDSMSWYEEAFIYAIYTGKKEEAKKFVGKFKPLKRESYMLLYYYLVENHKYGDALRILEEFVKKYPNQRNEILKELMIAYFLAGKIRRGEKILEEIVKKETNEKREKLILISIRKLMQVGAYERAKKIIWKYIKEFKGNKRLLTELLKLSLQTGDPEFAAQVAEEIIREE